MREITNTHVQTVNHLCELIHQHNVDAGWYDNIETGERKTGDEVFAEKTLLIHSEISEAVEGWRKNLMDDHLPNRKMVEVEFADAFIRLADLAAAMNLDLGGAIQEKFKYNQTRSDHKIENRKKEHGKKC